MIINISKQLWLQLTILKTNNLHTVVWFQVFLSVIQIFIHNNKNNNNNNNNNKKRICKIVDFAVPAAHRIKLKESEEKDKYLNLARELKK